jgi:hypothetical protein
MKRDYTGDAHEIWVLAQRRPNEGITDCVDRIIEKLEEMEPDLKELYATIDEIYDIAKGSSPGVYDLDEFDEEDEEYQIDGMTYDFTRVAMRCKKAMALINQLCSPKP